MSTTVWDTDGNGNITLEGWDKKFPKQSGKESMNSFTEPPTPASFLVAVTGRIENAEIFGVDEVYCKYSFAFGNDWSITSGMDEGISQCTLKDEKGEFVFNFPLEVTFKSSNPHGWPQLVISVFGADIWGNNVAKGYGSTHFPTCHGSYMKTVHLFAPKPSSFIQKFLGWFTGTQPEFVEPKLVAESEGRQMIRVQSNGYIVIKFEVVIKDMKQMGFVTSQKVHREEN